MATHPLTPDAHANALTEKGYRLLPITGPGTKAIDAARATRSYRIAARASMLAGRACPAYLTPHWWAGHAVLRAESQGGAA